MRVFAGHYGTQKRTLSSARTGGGGHCQPTAPGRMALGRSARSREAVGARQTHIPQSRPQQEELLYLESRNSSGRSRRPGKQQPHPERGASGQRSGLSSSLPAGLGLLCVVTMRTRGEKAVKHAAGTLEKISPSEY